MKMERQQSVKYIRLCMAFPWNSQVSFGTTDCVDIAQAQIAEK